ncbi:hypothetical protein RvY_11889-2 [Ramazzottius varieornatus]|uniref:Major facilitator superfamily associated domain-containing protein n=1 Tax=Ramazzottius varieornatus TaxID=947166 RepID=A0A1D1VHN8_RAMVA|nr:hypothetical protein RvY_11889-2 [Ramazzottius varieornatus]
MFWGVLGTSLEPYLASFGCGAQVEGLIFAAAFLAYAGTAPIFGWIFLKFHVDYRWAVLAPLGVAICCMFLGPIPSFTFIPPRLLWLVTLLLFIMNVFIAFGSVLVFDTLKERAIACGLEENVATYALILAVFFTTIYIGDALGAIIGSVVYFEYGFVRIAEIATGLLFAFSIIAALILLVDCGRLREPAHRMFPSLIKASSDREAQAEETSHLIKPGYPTRDNLGELPDYDEATTMQQPTGVFFNQSNNDYGSIR